MKMVVGSSSPVPGSSGSSWNLLAAVFQIRQQQQEQPLRRKERGGGFLGMHESPTVGKIPTSLLQPWCLDGLRCHLITCLSSTTATPFFSLYPVTIHLWRQWHRLEGIELDSTLCSLYAAGQGENIPSRGIWLLEALVRPWGLTLSGAHNCIYELRVSEMRLLSTPHTVFMRGVFVIH